MDAKSTLQSQERQSDIEYAQREYQRTKEYKEKELFEKNQYALRK